MRHQTAFVITGVLTAFVLIFAGGIAFTLNPHVPGATPEPTLGIPTNIPEVFAIALPTNPSTATATSVPTVLPTPPQTVFLSTAQAKALALKLAPQGMLETPPELVNYKGRMAYEVRFDVGTVYLDAFTGKLLFNGIGLVMAQPTPVPYIDPGATGGGDGGGGGGGADSTGDTAQQPFDAPPPPSAPPQSAKHGDSRDEDEQENDQEHEQGHKENKEHKENHEDEHEGQEHH